MKQFLYISFIFLSLYTKGQNYALEHYKFDTYYKMMLGYYHRGLYQESLQFLDSLQGNMYMGKHAFYFVAGVYSLNNEFDKTLQYLQKAVEKGVTKEQVEVLYDLDKFRESHLYMVFELNYDKWHQQYLNKWKDVKMDSVYMNEIEGLYAEFQKNSPYKIIKIDGDEIYELKDSVEQYQFKREKDSITYEKLTDLIIKKGFPVFKKVGQSFYTVSNMLMYHYNNIIGFNESSSKWAQIKPLIQKEINLGNLKPFYLAHFEDLNKVSLNLPQVYLTVKTYFSDSEKDTTQVEDAENINQRRKSVGLCSVQIDYWSEAKELPISLKNIEFK